MSQIDEKQLAAAIDHTLLAPDATADDIKRIAAEAVQYEFAAVCVNPRWISLAADLLSSEEPLVAAVISPPLGADSTDIKVAQTKKAIFAGADEIDMVADIACIIDADADSLARQILAVSRQCRSMRPPVTLKVIIESAALTDQQIVFACDIAQKAGADFVKTSTGLPQAAGATADHVKLMAQAAPACKVEAAGAITTAAHALEMLEAGASRIATTAAIEIINEPKAGKAQ